MDNRHDLPSVPPRVSFIRPYLPEDRQGLFDIDGVGRLKLRRNGEEVLEQIWGYLAGR